MLVLVERLLYRENTPCLCPLPVSFKLPDFFFENIGLVHKLFSSETGKIHNDIKDSIYSLMYQMEVRSSVCQRGGLSRSGACFGNVSGPELHFKNQNL